MISNDITIKYRYLFLIIVANFILQSTIFQAFKVNQVTANFTLVLVLMITIIYGIERGLFTAVFAGLFTDVFLSMAIGLNLFILVIIAFLMFLLGRPLFTGNKWTLVLLTVFSTIIYHLLYFFFMYFLYKGVSFKLVMTHIVPMEIILNAFVCYVAYSLAIRLLDRYYMDQKGDYNVR